MKISKCIQILWIFALIAGFVLGLMQARALAGGVTPPDLSVCDTVEDVCDAEMSVCKGGYRVTLTNFMPAAPMDSGMATYTYTICSPALGSCSSGPLNGTQCADNNDCSPKCNTGQGTCQGSAQLCTEDSDCVGTCNRDCADTAIDGDFKPLNKFDIGFPILARDVSCLSDPTTVTGACVCSTNTSGTCSLPMNPFSIGDATCFPNTCEITTNFVCQNLSGNKTCVGGPLDGQTCSNDGSCNPGMCSDTGDICFNNGNCPNAHVASCSVSTIGTEDCVQMTLQIAGEGVDWLGKGPIVAADKESNDCSSACIQGPSCNGCETPPAGAQCLTRTIGFWGNHPWITNNYGPVTVCGANLVCDGPPTANSMPSCEYGNCNDIMEGLGSIGGELNKNAPYVAMVKQLTAAQLGLNATADLFEDSTCSSFCWNNYTKMQVDADSEGNCPEGTETIQDVITHCEGLCSANKSTISSSGCIEALTAFNQSEDVIDDSTPPPFDQPPVDDFGNKSGADSSSFTGAGKTKLVIGSGGTCGP
jgi:hypothetical protein